MKIESKVRTQSTSERKANVERYEQLKPINPKADLKRYAQPLPGQNGTKRPSQRKLKPAEGEITKRRIYAYYPFKVKSRVRTIRRKEFDKQLDQLNQSIRMFLIDSPLYAALYAATRRDPDCESDLPTPLELVQDFSFPYTKEARGMVKTKREKRASEEDVLVAACLAVMLTNSKHVSVTHSDLLRAANNNHVYVSGADALFAVNLLEDAGVKYIVEKSCIRNKVSITVSQFADAIIQTYAIAPAGIFGTQIAENFQKVKGERIRLYHKGLLQLIDGHFPAKWDDLTDTERKHLQLLAAQFMAQSAGQWSAFETSGFVHYQCWYFYQNNNSKMRQYEKGGIQNLPKLLQAFLFPGHTFVNLDIKSCHLQIMINKLDEIGYEFTMPDCPKGVDPANFKVAVLAIINGCGLSKFQKLLGVSGLNAEMAHVYNTMKAATNAFSVQISKEKYGADWFPGRKIHTWEYLQKAEQSEVKAVTDILKENGISWINYHDGLVIEATQEEIEALGLIGKIRDLTWVVKPLV